MLERPCTCGTKCLIVSLLLSPLKLIKNERHKRSLVPQFLTIHIMPYYSLCKMVIFAISQVRAIFLPIKCFLNQFFSHQTILMRFLLICVFSSQVFMFQLSHLTQKKEKKRRQLVWQEIVLFVFVFCFFFFSNCAG